MLQRLFGRLKINWLHKLKSIMDLSDKGTKRPSTDDTLETEENAKKQKTAVNLDRKRKCVIMFGYNGKGYFGLQRNLGFKTIEEDLCQALLNAELIPLEHFEYMKKMSFQRAARTDKNVSAVGNCVSLKMLMNKENLVDEINSHLPAEIRVFECFRTTQGFNCKNHCDARTYSYILPTYAFAHRHKPLTVQYTMDADTLEKANVVLNLFRGTHNFHNYTSGTKPTDRSATRFIMDFECRTPFVRHGVEFCEISVKGQSFMLHQIRKMIGTCIAVLKGYIDEGFIPESFKQTKMFLPKAPGLGLMLEKLHYPEYNKRHGSTHKKIDFESIRDKAESFKEEAILSAIYKTEVEEYSMLKWLPELEGLSFAIDESQEDEKFMKLREERYLMTNKFIYGPDYVPPEKIDFTDSNDAEPTKESKLNTSANQEPSSEILTNEIELNEKQSNQLPEENKTELKMDTSAKQAPAPEILTNEKEANNKQSNQLPVEDCVSDKGNVDTCISDATDVSMKSESVIEEGAR